MRPPNRFIVSARADGRGGFRPFGTYSSKQAGARVTIGGRFYKVGKDGRVNIPKATMNRMGTTGDDGRMRVVIEFSSSKGPLGWMKTAAVIGKPPGAMKDASTGDIVGRKEIIEDVLEPSDAGDYTWSP
ncbi:hypothetical protein ES708_14349 [subsurface metagenome]